jgi:hypothetical protein
MKHFAAWFLKTAALFYSGSIYVIGVKPAEPEVPFLNKADYEIAIRRQWGDDIEGIQPFATRLRGRVKTRAKAIGSQKGAILVEYLIGDMHWKWAQARKPMG